MRNRYFIITIDTEGDNLWAKPSVITTENAKYLLRFQKLCDKYNFYPVYLTNYEMATCKEFVDFAKPVQKEDRCEIGMHLHAWNNPPYDEKISENDYLKHPFLIEYSYEAIFRKVKTMTDLLENIFETKMITHRAGRWAINKEYIRCLIEHGYKADCSMTPYLDWSETSKSNEQNIVKVDYTCVQNKFYEISEENIFESGNSGIYELPCTVIKNPQKKVFVEALHKSKLYSKISNRLCTNYLWLRPNGKNLRQMLNIVRWSNEKKLEYLEFMLHSSELMPGGSPTFVTEEDINNLYNTLEILFNEISKNYIGITIKDFIIEKEKV